MTDNFFNYKEFIKLCGGLPDTNEKGNLDKYYVIELMRRGKDNPNMPAANYHFRNYYIYSWKDLDKYEKEVKDVCTLLNLRAYGSVNYKLMSQVALDTLAESGRRIALHDYKKFYSIFESCSGKFADRSNNIWVVDIDNIEGLKVNEVSYLDRMEEYIDSMTSGHTKNVILINPTKSGYHFITHPFNLQQFNQEYSRYFTGDVPDVKKNHLTLLYENLHN